MITLTYEELKEELKGKSPGVRRLMLAYMLSPPKVQDHADKYFEMIHNGADIKKTLDMMRDDWNKMYPEEAI